MIRTRKFLAEVGDGEFWLEVQAEPYYGKLGVPSWPTQLVVDQLTTSKVGALRARLAAIMSKYKSCIALLEANGFLTIETRKALKDTCTAKRNNLAAQQRSLIIFPLPDPHQGGAFSGWGIRIAGIWPQD